jgi:glycine betaine/proline transport system ATP-binding protein
LQLVGLERWADRYGHELSGGMQQRVGLARAFATDAAILLMDEPFSALDPLIRTKLQDELLALQARVRKTILFVTHDLDEALKLGNQTTVLEGGKIVQTGTPEDIVLRPANAYVGEFVQHMNPLSVLNGRMVMRQWHELVADGAQRWLDPGRQFSAALDDQGRPVSAAFEGRSLALRTSPAEGEGLIVADVDTPLRQLIQWCRSGNPVLLAEGGAVRGVCGPTDVIRALATSDARARALN